jgi:hypothetical protein
MHALRRFKNHALRPIRRIANRRTFARKVAEHHRRAPCERMQQPADIIIAGFWFYSFSEKVYGSVIILYLAAHTHFQK